MKTQKAKMHPTTLQVLGMQSQADLILLCEETFFFQPAV